MVEQERCLPFPFQAGYKMPAQEKRPQPLRCKRKRLSVAMCACKTEAVLFTFCFLSHFGKNMSSMFGKKGKVPPHTACSSLWRDMGGRGGEGGGGERRGREAWSGCPSPPPPPPLHPCLGEEELGCEEQCVPLRAWFVFSLPFFSFSSMCLQVMPGHSARQVQAVRHEPKCLPIQMFMPTSQ